MSQTEPQRDEDLKQNRAGAGSSLVGRVSPSEHEDLSLRTHATAECGQLVNPSAGDTETADPCGSETSQSSLIPEPQ